MTEQEEQGGSVVKNLPADEGDAGELSSIPGSGRPPGEGHGNPLQYSCLEKPMDGGPWPTTVQRVAESDTTEVIEHHDTADSFERENLIK